MVRQRKISEAGIQQYPAETLGNEIPTAAVPDRSSTDKARDTTPPMSQYRAAYELAQSTLSGRKLIDEVNSWIISRQKELVRRLEEGSISKEELEEEKAEIRQMEQQLKAFIQQVEASEKRAEEVFKKGRN